MFTNSGRTPMPSGKSRMNSSIPPRRSVGLMMPTLPRQLEEMAIVSALYRRGDFRRQQPADAGADVIDDVLAGDDRMLHAPDAFELDRDGLSDLHPLVQVDRT